MEISVKLFIICLTQADGVSYIIQEIYGIENKKDGSKDKVCFGFVVSERLVHVFHQCYICHWLTKVDGSE